MTVRASNTTRANKARAAAEAAKTKKAAPKRSLLEAGAPDDAGEETLDDVDLELDEAPMSRLPPAEPAPRRRARAVDSDEDDDEETEIESEEEEMPTKEYVALRVVKLGVDTFFRRGEQLDIADKKVAAELLKKRSIVRVADLPRHRRSRRVA